MMSASTAKLVILYGIGGLSDVGRHAVRAALDAGVGQIRILTQHPHLLDSPDWKSACVDPHIFTDAERKRFQVIKVDLWDDPEEVQRLLPHFADATAVVTCVGNRQPGIYEPELKKGWVSFPANQLVVKAIETYSPQLKRVVAISSVGVAEGKRQTLSTFSVAVSLIINYLTYSALDHIHRLAADGVLPSSQSHTRSLVCHSGSRADGLPRFDQGR